MPPGRGRPICQRSRVDTEKSDWWAAFVIAHRAAAFRGRTDAAVYTEATDGRRFFVISWNERFCRHHGGSRPRRSCKD